MDVIDRDTNEEEDLNDLEFKEEQERLKIQGLRQKKIEAERKAEEDR